MTKSLSGSIYSPAAPRLWLRLLIPPAIWAIQAVTNYVLVPSACSSEGVSIAIHAISLGALAALGLSGLSARRKYKHVSATEADPDFWPAERWVPAAGFILSAAFFLVVLAQAMAPFILQRCE